MLRKIIRSLALMGALAIASVAWGQNTPTLLPNGMQVFLDNNGRPLANGKVYFYAPGTTTKSTTWQDSKKAAANTNPVILDSAGRATIYGYGTYRQVLQSSAGTTIWDKATTSTGGSSTPATIAGDGLPVGAVVAVAGLTVPSGYLIADGRSVARADYPELFEVLTQSMSVTCVSGSATIGVPDTTNVMIPNNIEASCLPPGTLVTAIAGATSLTVDNKATASATVTGRLIPLGAASATIFAIPDYRGRTLAAADNQGGTAANRLTQAGLVFRPGRLYGVGGDQLSTLATTNLPPYTPAGTVNITDPGHRHFVMNVDTGGGAGPLTNANQLNQINNSAADEAYTAQGNATEATLGRSSSSTTGVTAAFVGTAQGGTTTAFPNVQPTAVIFYVIKALPSAGAGVVNSIGGMTGSITCGEGILCSGQTISVDIPGLTAITTPEPAADYLMIYDDSAGGLRKITPANLVAPFSSGVSSLGGMTGAVVCGSGLDCSSGTISSTIGGNVINVLDYATCDNVTDDTAGFISLGAAISAAVSTTVEFPAHATCLVWPTNASANANPALITISNASGVVFNFNGSNLRSTFTLASSTVDALVISNSFNVEVNGYFHVASTGPIPTGGVGHIRLSNGANNIRVNNMGAIGGSLGVWGVRSPGSAVARVYNVQVSGTLTDVYYGINGQYDIDDLTATLHTTNAGRSYFPYGVKNHVVNIDSTNPASNDILIQTVAAAAGSAADNSTTGIRVKYTNRGSTTCPSVFFAHRQFGTNTANFTGYLDVEVDLDVYVPAASPSCGALVTADAFRWDGAAITLGDGGYVSRIVLSGNVRGEPATSTTGLVELGTTAQGFANVTNMKVQGNGLVALDALFGWKFGVGTNIQTTLTNVVMPQGNLTADAAVLTTSLRLGSVQFANINTAAALIAPGNAVPYADNTYSLGTSVLRWSDVRATTGSVSSWKFLGASSGIVTIQPAAAAGTWSLTLPTTDGNAGEVLTTDGSGVTSWAAAGGGSVTSVALTMPGVFSVAGSPITTSGTLAVTANGTSGGIPYFNATTTMASSAALAANQIVLGGGAGTAPATLGSLGTTTTVLHGNAAGAPTFGAVVSADLNITTTSCTNQFVTAISAGAVGTCTTATLASAQFANQGTTTTVLHGNAAGNPSFAQINLTTTVTGTLPVANGGTGAATLTGLLQGNGTSAVTAITNSSTVGQILRVTGAATYAWGALDLADTDAVTGLLPLANGGTNANLTASNGGIFYSTATAGAVLSGTATAGQILRSGSSAAPSWSTATYPATTTVSQILYSSSANVIGGITTANSGVLVTNSSGVPSIAVGQIPGTATNDAGSAGSIGEYVVSTIDQGSAVSLTTGTVTNITSISLTAGDWDVWLDARFTGGNTTTVSNMLYASISTTSATPDVTAGRISVEYYGAQTPFASSTAFVGFTVGPTRMSLSGTTTTYFVVRCDFAVSTCLGYGSLMARRVR